MDEGDSMEMGWKSLEFRYILWVEFIGFFVLVGKGEGGVIYG